MPALSSASASGRTAARGTRPRRTTEPGTPAPVRARKPRTYRPFTLAHFRAWAAGLILDTGQPWRLEPFQAAFVADVFAGHPECWLVVPEGNGKTTLVAGLALYHAEFRQLAAVSIAASSREQAEIMYRQAEGFVLRTPRLHELIRSPIQAAKGKQKLLVPRFTCLEGYRRINHAEGSRIQVFAADDRTGDGVIPTLAILDELHRHRDLGLYRTWAGKLGKRAGQIIAISTAGEPGSEFEATREQIRTRATELEVRGAFVRAASASMVLHEWALTAEADPEDFRAVKAANPFSGISVLMLAEKHDRPTMTRGHWLRFVCNRPTRSTSAAIEDAEWSAALSDEPFLPGVPIWLGLDVAWKWDTTAAVPLIWRDVHHRLLGPATILTPPRDGTSLDPATVEAALLAIHRRNPVHTVVMDPSRAEQLAAWIAQALGATVIERQQTLPNLIADYEHFMEALRSGWLRHSGDPGLAAHVFNATVRVLPSGSAIFSRPSEVRISAEQEHRVVDALAAAAMVNCVAALTAATPEPPKRLSAFLV